MQYKNFLTCCFCFVCCLASLSAQKTLRKVKGKASYYSDKLHGRKMSNGEIYHRDSMTCAHLHYPLGTLLRVRNPINDKEVFVRVTDRGPYSKRYIIDLSKAAAKELGFIRAGFCQVEITPIHPSRIPYRPDATNEIPELHLEYMEISTYPEAAWQQSENLKKKQPQKTKVKHLIIPKNKKN